MTCVASASLKAYLKSLVHRLTLLAGTISGLGQPNALPSHTVPSETVQCPCNVWHIMFSQLCQFHCNSCTFKKRISQCLMVLLVSAECRTYPFGPIRASIQGTAAVSSRWHLFEGYEWNNQRKDKKFCRLSWYIAVFNSELDSGSAPKNGQNCETRWCLPSCVSANFADLRLHKWCNFDWRVLKCHSSA